MPELGPYGSVRGARGNSRPYRERLGVGRGSAYPQIPDISGAPFTREPLADIAGDPRCA
jgi:hypothetical protein